MPATGTPVLVALSGGVDSSVSAALLKDAGYDVHTAFIKTWSAPWLPCTWRDERHDAMRVAAHLQVPFHTVDLSDTYEHAVVEYLVREYREGHTPNPDVMCNKAVKFGAFLQWALAHGFERIATGHYAQNEHGDDDAYHLLQGVDAGKDQTYFLWTLGQHELSHTLFPVGGMHKSEVRTAATEYGLHTATKKDSQGVCFLGKVDMKEFLSHYVPPQTGAVLDVDGTVIGEHDGALYVTLGQRHGFTIHHTSPHAPARYVVRKDVGANTITVSDTPRDRAGDNTTVLLTDVNWIAGRVPVLTTCQARLRYQQQCFPVHIATTKGTTATITLEEPQLFLPAGQSMVFYQGDECLGGGIIA